MAVTPDSSVGRDLRAARGVPPRAPPRGRRSSGRAQVHATLEGRARRAVGVGAGRGGRGGALQRLSTREAEAPRRRGAQRQVARGANAGDGSGCKGVRGRDR